MNGVGVSVALSTRYWTGYTHVSLYRIQHIHASPWAGVCADVYTPTHPRAKTCCQQHAPRSAPAAPSTCPRAWHHSAASPLVHLHATLSLPPHLLPRSLLPRYFPNRRVSLTKRTSCAQRARLLRRLSSSRAESPSLPRAAFGHSPFGDWPPRKPRASRACRRT